MQFELPFGPANDQRKEHYVELGSRSVPLLLIRNRRARRYVLRVSAEGNVRVTVPRGGSLREAHAFAKRNARWLEQQLFKRALQPSAPVEWTIGTEILLRGIPERLKAVPGKSQAARLGEELIPVKDPTGDLRHEVQRHLWRRAALELPPRVVELAALHQFAVERICVRNQRSRWGSCSRRRTISLNWRLIQVPAEVRDYLVLHELAHLKEMNHSRAFWREVKRLCPTYATAELWLKRHAGLLR